MQYNDNKVSLRLCNLQTDEEAVLDLKDKGFVYLGRKNIPGAPKHVSVKHLRIFRHGEEIHIEQVGKNSTLLAFNGSNETHILGRYLDTLKSGRLQDVVMVVGDMRVQMEITPSMHM